MVILLSALAVVAAAISLIAWFVVGGGFTLIYLAMALAVVSMLLLWAARWVGSSVAPAGSLAPSPLAEDLRVEVPVRDEAEPERRPAAGSFPIADYEHLWVTQILPLLPELDDDELAVVEARERGARHRGGILDGIDAERSRRRGEGEPTAAAPTAPPRSRTVDRTEAEEEADGEDLDGRLDESDPFARAWRALTDAEEASATDGADPRVDGEVEVEADHQVDVEIEAFAAELEPEPRRVSLVDRLRTRHQPDAINGPEPDLELEQGPEADEPHVELGAAAEGPEPEATDRSAELVGSGPAGGPRVRTFLGRVAAPITVTHAEGGRLP